MFSIIIPVYNAGNLIQRCVKSVMTQSDKDYEIIIIDDGSKDGSTDNIENILAGSQNCIVRVTNGGVSKARNIGLENSKGKYILFLDADDQLPEETIAIYKKWIDKENEPDVLFAGFYKDYPKKTKAFKLNMGEHVQILKKNDKLAEFNPFNPRLSGCVWGKCYKKSLLLEEEFNTELSLCEDAEFNFRVFKKAKSFVYIDECLYRYTYAMTSTIRRYDAGYMEKYIRALEEIDNKPMDSNAQDSFYQFACNVFNVICFNVVFTNQNTLSVSEKCDIIRQLRENSIFRKIIERVNITSIPFNHRVSIVLARKKVYIAIYWMSILNSIINKMLY